MNTAHNNGRRGTDSWLSISGKGIGLLAGIAGLFGAGYLLVASVVPYLFSSNGALAAENAPIFLIWSIVLVGLSLGAGYGAWKEKLWAVWGLTVVTSALSIITLFSFGAVVIPFAILLLIAAILLTADQASFPTE